MSEEGKLQLLDMGLTLDDMECFEVDDFLNDLDGY